jgi:hypothetical protein
MKRLVLFSVLFCGGALAVMAAMPETIVLPAAIGDVRFSHTSHHTTPCAHCHHTSTGTKVATGCHGCHRTDARELPNAEEVFHQSCVGCHKETRNAGEKSGPVKLCSECHRKSN